MSDNDQNPWDAYLVVIAMFASLCVVILICVSTYVLTRYLLGLT